MSLPLRARALMGTVAVVGVAVIGVAVGELVLTGAPSHDELLVVAVFGSLMLANWLWPLIIYADEKSKSLQFDEACLVALALLVPADATLIALASATLIAQLIRRRSLLKSAFNSGQLVISATAALSVFALIDRHIGRIGPLDAVAAVAAAAVYFTVNSLALSSVFAATGMPWRSAAIDWLGIRILFACSSVAVVIGADVAISAHLWSLPVAVFSLVILRQVLVGHFDAHHDRARLQGLYESALQINQSIGNNEVETAITESARNLLRCQEASLTDHPLEVDRRTEPNALRSVLSVPGRPLSLRVSGRSRTQSFEPTDQGLLDALAAVGSTALANAALYDESRFHRRRLAAITSSLGEGVCAVSRAGRVTFMNPAGAAMLGLDEVDELGEQEMSSILDMGSRPPNFILAPAMRSMAKCDTITNYDTRFRRADGTYFHVAFTVSPIFDHDEASGIECEGSDGSPFGAERTDGSSVPTGAVLVFRDITERKVFEEQLARHAFHDALTGLPNRRLFLDHLEHALRRSQRSGEQHAVLFADVDRFKLINDSLGHHAGDQLLIAIGEKLRTALRHGDVLARFGGDEFTILLEDVKSTDDPILVAKKILDHVLEPISLPDGHEVVATMSIGIAITTSDQTRDDVLHDADVAMYQAKARGRGGHYEVFDIDAMGVRSPDRVELELALRRALDREEFEVYYQPLVSLSDRRLLGAEALVRWNHPTRGLLDPEQFIALAEDTGLILRLGRLVVEKACRQAREWLDLFGVKLDIGLNLSARQFQQAGLVEELEEILRLTGIEPSQILLEITESLAADRVQQTIEILTQVKTLGCQVAIDDFGTGYSALGYLADFPVDVVKVDRSFIAGVDVDPVKSAIVSAVVTLAKVIGMVTVVEGVETEGQLEHLHSIGCEVAQGYYFSCPLSPAEFEGRFLHPFPAPAPVEGIELLSAS